MAQGCPDREGNRVRGNWASKPTRWVRRPIRHRYEVIAIGHLHLWQTLRVRDVGFLDDAIHVEYAVNA